MLDGRPMLLDADNRIRPVRIRDRQVGLRPLVPEVDDMAAHGGLLSRDDLPGFVFRRGP